MLKLALTRISAGGASFFVYPDSTIHNHFYFLHDKKRVN